MYQTSGAGGGVLRSGSTMPRPAGLALLVATALSLDAAAARATFWARERPDGVVEFTNRPPVGKHWRVWLKTGPGKAAALRGQTDLVPPRDSSPARLTRYDQHIRDQQAFYGIP